MVPYLVSVFIGMIAIEQFLKLRQIGSKISNFSAIVIQRSLSWRYYTFILISVLVFVIVVINTLVFWTKFSQNALVLLENWQKSWNLFQILVKSWLRSNLILHIDLGVSILLWAFFGYKIEILREMKYIETIGEGEDKLDKSR